MAPPTTTFFLSLVKDSTREYDIVIPVAIYALGHLDLLPFQIVGALPEQLGDGPVTEAADVGNFSKARGMGPVNPMAVRARRSPQIHSIKQ